jgi:hypothetical protein
VAKSYGRSVRFCEASFYVCHRLDETEYPPPLWCMALHCRLFYALRRSTLPRIPYRLFGSADTLSRWLSSYCLSAVRAAYLPTSMLSFVYSRKGYNIVIDDVREGLLPFRAISSAAFGPHTIWKYVAIHSWHGSPVSQLCDTFDGCSIPDLKAALRHVHSSSFTSVYPPSVPKPAPLRITSKKLKSEAKLNVFWLSLCCGM